MHVEMMDVFASADPYIVLEAFREAGKTTKLEEHTILGGCFGNYHYGLILGETYEKACDRLRVIAHECSTNERLIGLFGGPVLAKKPIENKLWFASGAFIQALGWEQELQSFKYLAHRPDYAWLDDVENLERVRDKESVDASLYKLYHDLIPAMDIRHKIINGQTRRAEDCMVTRLASSPDWLYRGFPICDGDPDDERTVATWPQRYPMEWIRAKKAMNQRAGMLGAFLQAYMLQTYDHTSKPFKLEMLQAWDVSPHHWMPRYAIYDPSRTSNEKRSKKAEKSDRAGKVVVSRLGSKILVHESSGNFWKPDEFIADLFATNDSHRPAKVGVEKNSLDDWLLQPIRIESLRRGEAIPLVALTAPQDRSKDDFIMGLQPFAHAKDVVLIGGHMAHPQLVAEWCNFPQGPRDIMNALAYSLRMFAGVPMYEDFSGANIGDAPTPRLGESVYVGFTANASECVAVAVVRDGRRLCVAADFAASGALADAVKTLVFEVRSTFPRAALQTWVPADIYDQWQRVALVPALRAARLTPMRGEHVGVSRGTLSERIRTTWHNQRLLMVDLKARLTLNALSAGYALAVERGGRTSKEPEPGLSRMAAEALECVAAVLDRIGEEGENGFPKGANLALNASGQAYVTANPRARS